MVDRILLECLKYAIQPDIILFNGAIDAYIRCVTGHFIYLAATDMTDFFNTFVCAPLTDVAGHRRPLICSML
jgi:hypothetical protein